MALLLTTGPGRVDAAAGWAPTGSLPGLGTGHIWSVAVSPADPNALVAGTDNGIYASADGGTTWHLTTVSGVRVWVVGYDVRNAKTVVAGTEGHGARMSADGGQTWHDASQGLPSMNVRSLAFSLSEIAAGTDNGVATSTNGSSWSRGGLDGVTVSALAVVANSPNLVLIAGTDAGDVAQGYLWTNSGSTWGVVHGTGLPSSAVVLSLASGPISQAITHRPLIADTSQGTFRSLDSGATWTGATNLPAVGTNPLTLTTSLVSPLDPDLVYSGADAGGSSGGAMMRSVDAGVTYTDIAQGMPDQKRNVVSIAMAPTTPPTVFAAVDPSGSGGVIYRFVDTGAPPPPALVGEAPGAVIPVVVGTPKPTPNSKSTPHPTAKPASGGIGHLLSTVFHWPTPLVYELIGVLLVAYAVIRWRQRAYIEGPP